MRRVLVCGGREYNDRKFMFEKLSELHAADTFSVLIAGGAPGADSLAVEWARSNGIEVAIYQANWNALGRNAGPVRNAKMLTHGKPDLVISFPGGRGTDDLLRRARSLTVAVTEFR
jgi:predicted Rossmann-fold nucleotide-binding protein